MKYQQSLLVVLPQANSKDASPSTQRSDSALHLLRDFRDGCAGLRMSLETANIVLRPRLENAARRFSRCRLFRRNFLCNCLLGHSDTPIGKSVYSHKTVSIKLKVILLQNSVCSQGNYILVTRAVRIAEFTTDKEPEHDIALELLCQDHVGTYALPFPCRRVTGHWRNQRTGQLIEVAIVGWRLWKRL
jgi:hypothetical protein